MARHRKKAAGGAKKWLGSALLLAMSSAAVARTGSAIAATADIKSERQIDRWEPHIAEASERFGIPRDWISRVMRAESGGATLLGGRPITSKAGAIGLMQLMPGTWAEMRAKNRLGPDPHQPRDNILAGAAYLRTMYDRFGYPGLFAAYNAGPKRYAEYLVSGRRLPAETIAYVAAIGANPTGAAANISKESPQSGIFVSLVQLQSRDTEAGPLPTASDALFVRLETASTGT